MLKLENIWSTLLQISVVERERDITYYFTFFKVNIINCGGIYELMLLVFQQALYL